MTDKGCISSTGEERKITSNTSGPRGGLFDESSEAAAGALRPGNAGANTAADQIAVSDH
jgi:hypothetical protein